MQQPNPWLLFIGGIALLNVSVMVWGLSAPLGVRYGGTILCIVLGFTAIGLGLARYLKKGRPPRPAVRGARATIGRSGAAAGPVRPRPGSGEREAR